MPARGCTKPFQHLQMHRIRHHMTQLPNGIATEQWKAEAVLFSLSHGPSTQTPVFGADVHETLELRVYKQCAFCGFKQLQLRKKCVSSTLCNLQVEGKLLRIYYLSIIVETTVIQSPQFGHWHEPDHDSLPSLQAEEMPAPWTNPQAGIAKLENAIQ